jgi:hypothetical protein
MANPQTHNPEIEKTRKEGEKNPQRQGGGGGYGGGGAGGGGMEPNPEKRTNPQREERNPQREIERETPGRSSPGRTEELTDD